MHRASVKHNSVIKAIGASAGPAGKGPRQMFTSGAGHNV